MENTIHEVLKEILDGMQSPFSKIKIEEKPDGLFKVYLESDEPNRLIGYHGENIMALQHLLKVLVREKAKDREISIYLDIDNYRKRQEENVLKMAERKVDMVRQLNSSQSLPAMSPYFRRLVHLHLAQEKFLDIKTESEGEGDFRFIIIKPNLAL